MQTLTKVLQTYKKTHKLNLKQINGISNTLFSEKNTNNFNTLMLENILSTQTHINLYERILSEIENSLQADHTTACNAE